MKAAQTASPRRQRTFSLSTKIDSTVTRLGMRKRSAKASAKGKLVKAMTLKGVVTAMKNTRSVISQGLCHRTRSCTLSPGFMKAGESARGMR